MIFSSGLIVTGQFVQNAVNYANNGGYLSYLHLHFNLSANLLNENSEDVPLTETMRKDPFFVKMESF